MSSNEGDARSHDAVAIEVAPEQTPVEQFDSDASDASRFEQASTWDVVAAGLNQCALMDVGGGLDKPSYLPGREVEDQLAELLVRHELMNLVLTAKKRI